MYSVMRDSFLSVTDEAYYPPCSKISLHPEFSNISLVVRVGANDNVKLILVSPFKVASVSSAKLLSILRMSRQAL